MNKKPYLITTSCDKKYGDFLIEHWFFSLQKNVDLSKIDILVLDYDLSKAQSFYLKNHNVLVKECKKDGHVVNLRFRDLLDFLNQNFYEQILMCDGGDIIFQADISFLFEENKDSFRAVCENVPPFFDYFLRTSTFYRSKIRDIKELLSLKTRTINAGFIIAPYEKMKFLCSEFVSIVKNFSKFWTDQIVINYVFYREGFVELQEKYNFTLGTHCKEFEIKNEVFFSKEGDLIPVVHNTGWIDLFRPVKNFGFLSTQSVKVRISFFLRLFFLFISRVSLWMKNDSLKTKC